ncbi:MAG: class I SAM-dependent methyltransferase [Anaerolineae bacterium]|nr:class I SAM-dependent methyltransferase [Anaerolineae bacterium]
MTEPYEILSALYDSAGWAAFAENMADRVLALAAEHDLGKIDHIVDVACGTGVAAAKFAAAGYRVTGVDRSPQMLAQARRRVAEAGLPRVTLVEADMRDFALDEPADLVTCMYDSLNYLLEKTDLLAAFRCAATALRGGGLYIFDMNTVFGLAEGWGSRDFVRWDSEDCFIVGRTCWNYERLTNALTLHGFIRRGELWERFAETHVQRGYPVTTIRALLEQAGLAVLTVYNPFAEGTAEPGSEMGRVLIVARKTRGGEEQ